MDCGASEDRSPKLLIQPFEPGCDIDRIAHGCVLLARDCTETPDDRLSAVQTETGYEFGLAVAAIFHIQRVERGLHCKSTATTMFDVTEILNRSVPHDEGGIAKILDDRAAVTFGNLV